jgi:hypothetical protein
MVKVKLNPMFQSTRGRLGNFVLRRTLSGKLTLITLDEMSDVTWSQAHKAHRQRFKQAVAHAKAAMAETKTRAHYEKAAAKAGKRPFDLAVSDYFKDRNLLEK